MRHHQGEDRQWCNEIRRKSRRFPYATCNLVDMNLNSSVPVPLASTMTQILGKVLEVGDSDNLPVAELATSRVSLSCKSTPVFVSPRQCVTHLLENAELRRKFFWSLEHSKVNAPIAGQNLSTHFVCSSACASVPPLPGARRVQGDELLVAVF